MSVIERMDERDRQGAAGRPGPRTNVEFELYQAAETTELEPGRLQHYPRFLQAAAERLEQLQEEVELAAPLPLLGGQRR